jgi:hypothetical protein
MKIYSVSLNSRKRIFLIATSVGGKQFRTMLGYWPLMSVEAARALVSKLLCTSLRRKECRKLFCQQPHLTGGILRINAAELINFIGIRERTLNLCANQNFNYSSNVMKIQTLID